MTWFENIKTFFVDNAQSILAWLTPANIAAVITAIILAIKNGRSTKKNTVATSTLTDNIGTITDLTTTVKDNSATVTNLSKDVVAFEGKYEELDGKVTDVEKRLTDKFDIIDSKISAMLDVQSMVYGTIQNDDLRMNVQNAIANAKIASDTTRSELKKQIESLKTEIVEQAESFKTKITEGTTGIQDTVETKKRVKRY